MDGTEEEQGGGPRQAADSFPQGVPPLRLAGIDEDDMGEPHLVRGID